MTHPLYNPLTAFGNKILLRDCPQIIEKEDGEDQEEEELTEIAWNSEATEFSLCWLCPCGARNEDTVDEEPSSGDEVQCYKCSKMFILR